MALLGVAIVIVAKGEKNANKFMNGLNDFKFAVNEHMVKQAENFNSQINQINASINKKLFGDDTKPRYMFAEDCMMKMDKLDGSITTIKTDINQLGAKVRRLDDDMLALQKRVSDINPRSF